MNNEITNTIFSFVPGTTKFSAVQNKLDAPKETLQTSDKTIYTYLSSDPSRSNIVYVQNDIITFVQVVLSKGIGQTLEQIVAQYGKVENKSYSTHAIDSPVYSYPNKGLSFFVDGATGKTFMIQKYTPISQQVFAETIGKNFTTEPYGDPLPPSASPATTLQPTVQPQSVSFLSRTNSTIIIIAAIIFVLIISTLITIAIIRKRRKINEPTEIHY